MDGLLPCADDEAATSLPLLPSGASSSSLSSEVVVSRDAVCIGGQGIDASRSQRSKMQMYGKADGGAPFISVDLTVESSASYQQPPSRKYARKWPLMNVNVGVTSSSPSYATYAASLYLALSRSAQCSATCSLKSKAQLPQSELSRSCPLSQNVVPDISSASGGTARTNKQGTFDNFSGK